MASKSNSALAVAKDFAKYLDRMAPRKIGTEFLEFSIRFYRHEGHLFALLLGENVDWNDSRLNHISLLLSRWLDDVNLFGDSLPCIQHGQMFYFWDSPERCRLMVTESEA